MSMELKLNTIVAQNKEQTKKLDAMYAVLLDTDKGIVVRVTKLETKQGTIISTMIGLFTGAYTGLLTVLTKLFII